MAKIVITHAVVEIDRWLEGKADRTAAISRYASGVTDHIALDGSTQVAVTADVHDMAGLEAMLASPPADVAAQMERHGVVPPIAMYVER